MEQSSPGPEHQTTITESEIQGVLLMTVPTANYEFGSLSEIFNPEWDSIYNEPIEHMYVITNSANQREHWHVHLNTIDRYVLLSGEIEVALFDNREDSPTQNTLTRHILVQVGTTGVHGLRIPAGVWHTFRSVGDGFSLLNNKSPRFNRENPDKFSIPLENDTVSFSW